MVFLCAIKPSPLLSASIDEFYKKMVCGEERPRLRAALPGPLRSLIRRCWATDPVTRPSMSMVLVHLAFISAENQREHHPKGHKTVRRSFYGGVGGTSDANDCDTEPALRLRSDCGPLRIDSGASRFKTEIDIVTE